jgi:hypothetical protein
MKILSKMDYFLLNSFTSVAEILDDFPHPRVSQWLLALNQLVELKANAEEMKIKQLSL